MGLLACVEIRALPLQLLMRAHPDWRHMSVVVLDREKPTGVIQWANERATAKRIFPGMRFASGVSIDRELRGGVMPDADIAQAVNGICHNLWRFSPAIEPSATEPGVFWLDVSGLHSIFPSLDTWASDIHDDLRRRGYTAVVIVGFTKFGTYAAAKASDRNRVFPSREHERAFVAQVNIERVIRDARFRDRLFRLNVRTLGGLLRLTGDGLHKRFGSEARALYELASCDGWDMLQPKQLYEPVERREPLDYPEDSSERLVFRFAGMLHALLAELQARHEVLRTLHFSLRLGDGTDYEDDVSPAVPTLDATQILSILRLRLESITLSASVMEITARALGVGVSYEQLGLFEATAQRNIEAAQRFYAKIRAKRGHDRVVVARLQDGQLPEAKFTWEPLDKLVIPKAIDVAVAPLVRVIFSPPIELPGRERHEPDGWLIAGLSEGPVEEVIGPQDIWGGWWTNEIRRAYYYVRTRSGRWLWIYNDSIRRRWYLHGEVQ